MSPNIFLNRSNEQISPIDLPRSLPPTVANRFWELRTKVAVAGGVACFAGSVVLLTVSITAAAVAAVAGIALIAYGIHHQRKANQIHHFNEHTYHIAKCIKRDLQNIRNYTDLLRENYTKFIGVSTNRVELVTQIDRYYNSCKKYQAEFINNYKGLLDNCFYAKPDQMSAAMQEIADISRAPIFDFDKFTSKLLEFTAADTFQHCERIDKDLRRLENEVNQIALRLNQSINSKVRAITM